MSFVFHISIYAGIDKVFAYVTQHEIRRYWQAGLVKTIIHTRSSANEDRMGEDFIDLCKHKKRLRRTDGTIFIYQQLSLFALRISDVYYCTDTYYYFTTIGNCTELTVRTVVHFHNLFFRIAAVALNRRLEKKLGAQLLALKRLAENG